MSEFLQAQLARLKAAGITVPPTPTRPTIDAKASGTPHVKRYTAYGHLAGMEYPIGWNLNLIEAESIIASARRRLIKCGLTSDDGKPLFEVTSFTMEETI